MNIAVLGSGAMGSLFGSYLSRNNNVWLIDKDLNKINKINTDGVTISENNSIMTYKPKAVSDSSNLAPMDLIIVFVKSMNTADAIYQNCHLIGQETYVMTLQNGAGHEKVLSEFIDKNHIIIGTTEHNSSIITTGHINHGGRGLTIIGGEEVNSVQINRIAENFNNCGIETIVSKDVKKHIWTKLFLNTSASSLTAILQVPLGFILENPYARSMMHRLAKEAICVANADIGAEFVNEEIIMNIEKLLNNSKNGYTSIYSDIKNGAKTEVETISGTVLDLAKKYNIYVPYHEFIVSIIHALEDKALLNNVGGKIWVYIKWAT